LTHSVAAQLNKPRKEKETADKVEVQVAKRVIVLSPGKRSDNHDSSSSKQAGAPKTRHCLLSDIKNIQPVHELGTDVSLDLQKPAKADSSGSDGNFLTHFNIDDLPRNKTSVKVLILHPNGDVIIKTPQGQAMNTIKNLALKRWKAAANAFIADEATKPDLLIALNRSVNKELKIFCKSETILKGKQVDQLKAFSNKILQKETEDLPFWNVSSIWNM
jgi:hypothetical protein